MSRLKEIMQEIEILRAHLQKLMEEKEEIVDAEILSVSKMIDVLLNEYYALLKNKNGANNWLLNRYTAEYLYAKSLTELGHSFAGCGGYADAVARKAE